jgi:hypothetical protein
MPGRSRVRGFAPWQPRGESLQRLEQVKQVLKEYAAYLPLTIRQIFYRLVASVAYEKTERAYKNLAEMLNRARRAELVPFSAIRDDGFQVNEAPGWSGEDQFFTFLRHEAASFTLDRQEGQACRLVMMCEAAGMAPQLQRVAHPLGVPVIASGGFDSTQAKHALARRIADEWETAEILHIGDYDPSGVHVFNALQEDIAAFCASLGGSVRFTRLAVTPAQIKALALPTAPRKETDNRTFAGLEDDANATVQAEAIPPEELAGIVRQALLQRIDHDALAAVEAAEAAARARLSVLLEGIA